MRRIALIVAAVIVALAVLVLVLLARPLRDARLREAIEARLSATLGQPVSIGDLGLGFFPALTVTGSSVRIGETDVQAPAVQVRRIVIHPRVGALFRGDVAIQDVQLDGFVVSVLRDRDGAWHVPSAVPAPTAQRAAGATIERVRISDGRVRIFDGTPGGEMHEAASIDAIETTIDPAEDGLRLSPITGRIGSATISGEARTDPRAVRLEFEAEGISDGDLPALLALLGAKRPDFLRLAEPASLTADMRVARESSRLSGRGTLRAPQVQLDTVTLQQFDAPFAVDGGRLEFAPTTFTLYGGAHTGPVTIRLADPARWSIDSRVTGMDVGDFLDALAGGDQRLEGTGAVTAALNGRVDETLRDTASGRMQVVVTNGVIRDFPLLASIDRALRLTDQQGGDTTFERLSATFEITRGAATTDDLVIDAGHARVHARGRIGGDQTLEMRGAAVLSPERSAQAIASVRELSGLRNAKGEVEIPLTITGTLDAPSFALDLKAAIGKGIGDELRRRLQRIIKR